MKIFKSRKIWGAAVTAAALLLLIGVFLAGNKTPVFHGVFADDSGLAMVREGNAGSIRKDAERKHTLYVAAADMQGITNPVYAASEADKMISSLIFEPFMRRDGEGVWQKELADHFQMETDGSRCSITLKKKIRFSDGSPVTARDAAFSIAAMCMDPQAEENSPYMNIEGAESFLRGETELPSGIEVKDDTHLEIAFSKASPDNLLIAGCKIQKQPEQMDTGIAIVLPQIASAGTGTGAYVKTEGRDGGSIRLTASENYRKKIRDIKNVEFVLYGSYAVEDAIKNGDVDVACFYGNSTAFDPFYEGMQYTIYEKPVDSVQYLSINRDNMLLRKEKARRAISLAIDRDGFTGGALSRYFMAANALAWERSAYEGKDMPVYDTEAARKLLDDVKQEMGEVSLKLRLPVLKGNATHEELGKQVKNDLEKIGFQVDEQALDQGEYLQQVYMLGNYDLLITSMSGWETYSAYDRILSDSQGVSTGSASDQVKAAINKLNVSYEQNAVNESLKDANSVLNRLVPVIPVSRQKKFTAVSADLKNCRMTRYDPFIINVYDIRVK